MWHVGRKYCFHYFTFFFLHYSSFLFAISDFAEYRSIYIKAMTKNFVLFFYVVPSEVIVCDHVISMQPTESWNVEIKRNHSSHAIFSRITDDNAKNRLSMLTAESISLIPLRFHNKCRSLLSKVVKNFMQKFIIITAYRITVKNDFLCNFPIIFDKIYDLFR